MARNIFNFDILQKLMLELSAAGGREEEKPMAVIDTKQIRNLVLLGHGGCGKTSLAEAMIYTLMFTH